MYFRTILTGALALSTLGTAHAQNDYFTNWPAGTRPQEVGKQLADHFVTSPHQYTKTIHYSEICTWYGALTFAQLTHDTALRDQLIKKFEPLMPGGAEAERSPIRHHVDDSIFGVAPLEIAIQTKDPKYLAVGKSWADRQWGPVSPGTPVELTPDLAAKSARRPVPRNPLLGRRHVHAHHAAARGLPRHRRHKVPRPRRQGDGRLPRQAATAQRPLLPRARREVLLGSRRWLGRSRHGRDAPRACRPITPTAPAS